MSDKPILMPREDGKWELAADYGDIPKGFVTDGGTIPRFWWRVVGTPVDAETIGAYIKHDWKYYTGCVPRLQADEELYRDLRAAGVGYFRAKAVYFAVRACGWQYYNEPIKEGS